MKKWTVMLIPHDRGGTRTLTLSSLHFWSFAILLAVLTFSTAFFYQRHSTVLEKSSELRFINRELELENARKPKVIETGGHTEAELREVEARLRSDYDASISTITAELNELYDIEAKARDITGLTPRPSASTAVGTADGGGKGGPPGAGGPMAFSGGAMALRPPNIIYGMTRPSADLILQEIHVRGSSFSDLVSDMEAEIDRIERIPSIWPLAEGAGHLTSRFGYRRDPFTRRVRHHNGTDLAGPWKTKIRATAKGVVLSAGYDRFLGRIVKIDHGNGIETWYAHLSRTAVKKGAEVRREDIIGTLGSTGRSTGPHLHYEVHVKGNPVNPEKYLTD